MSKKINLLLSIITLVVTSSILVMILFGWYVTNEKVSANGIVGESATDTTDGLMVRFNIDDEKVDVPMIPGNFSELKINVKSESIKGATLKFISPKIGWKNIVTKYTSLNSLVDFEPNIYYSKDSDTYTLIEEKPADWTTNYSSYYSVSDEVITMEDLGETEVKMPFERLYGVNSFYSKNGDTYTKRYMSLGEKREEFLKLWKDNLKVNMSSSIKVYVSKTKIKLEDYESVLLPKYRNDEFESISDNTVEYDNVTPTGESMYFYFYFDETDLYFNTSGSTYFYGENPFFLQTCTLDLLITKKV